MEHSDMYIFILNLKGLSELFQIEYFKRYFRFEIIFQNIQYLFFLLILCSDVIGRACDSSTGRNGGNDCIEESHNQS